MSEVITYNGKQYELTGEKRLPRKGELYYCRLTDQVSKAVTNFDYSEYEILREKPAEAQSEKTITIEVGKTYITRDGQTEITPDDGNRVFVYATLDGRRRAWRRSTGDLIGGYNNQDLTREKAAEPKQPAAEQCPLAVDVRFVEPTSGVRREQDTRELPGTQDEGRGCQHVGEPTVIEPSENATSTVPAGRTPTKIEQPTVAGVSEVKRLLEDFSYASSEYGRFPHSSKVSHEADELKEKILAAFAQLRERLAELESIHCGWPNNEHQLTHCGCKLCGEIQERLAGSEQRVAELEAVLKPFAEMAEESKFSQVRFDINDLRRADIVLGRHNG